MTKPLKKVLFYEEKREIVTNILDAAVKSLGLQQAAYLKLKASLLGEIELSGNEGLGISEVVQIVNRGVAEEVGHSGLVIVNPKRKEIIGALKASARITYSPRTSKQRKPPMVRGKERLIKFLELLSPYFTQEEFDLYRTKLRASSLGKRTGSSTAKTTGDVEYEVILNARQKLGIQFDAMVAKSPSAFIDEYKSAAGIIKKENIAINLKKQIQTVVTFSELLSLKDLIDRHVKHAEKMKKKNKTFVAKLKFWKK